MKRAIALLAGLALFAAACGDDDPATDTTDSVPTDTVPTDSVSADSGDEPTVERIVSLSPTATEILFAIGAGERVVAVDQFSNHPAEAPFSDLDGFTVNVEAVAAYEPQLVIMQSNQASAELEALGIEVIVQDSPADIDGIYAQIEQIGAATGDIAGAAEVVLDMQTRLAELIAEAPSADGMTYYHELGTDYYSLNSESFVAQIYALFGLETIGDQADGEAFAGYLPLSEEFILGADPDLIFLADTIYAGQTAETVAARPGWSDLSAVRNGAVIELDDDIASRWGPRVVEFAEAIAAALTLVSAPA